MKKIASSQEEWDKKKVIIASIVVGVFGIGAIVAKLFLFPDVGTKQAQQLGQSVRGGGASTQNQSGTTNTKSAGASSSVSSAVAEKIAQIKQEVSGINVANVASSTPQIQKLIQDIQALQGLPKDETQALCKQICGGK